MQTKEEQALYSALKGLGFRQAGAVQAEQKTADMLNYLQTLGISQDAIKDLGIEQKANEVMHTGNTGYGAEFVPSEVLASEIFDLVPKRATLLPLLPGNHGSGLPKTYKAPVKKLSQGDFEFEGKDEWTTGDKITSGDGDRQPTAVATLNQASFIAKVDISDEQLKYNAVNTEEYVRERILEGMAYTVDAVIINGDSEAGATGNVNLDDAAPASTKYYLKIDGGIRERVINGSYNVNGGTLDSSDFLSMISGIGEYASAPEDCLILSNRSAYNKAMSLSEVLTHDKFGPEATIKKGVLGSVFGIPYLVHRAVPKTEADGKVSTTAANNTLGQILLVHAPSIQYGFGQDLKIEVVRVPGYGYQLVATFDFAFKIVDSDDSLTEPSVYGIRNITL